VQAVLLGAQPPSFRGSDSSDRQAFLHALFVFQAETIQAGRQIVNEVSRLRVGAQALKRAANPTGHELLSRPAGAQVSGLESCPERERKRENHVKSGRVYENTFCAMREG